MRESSCRVLTASLDGTSGTLAMTTTNDPLVDDADGSPSHWISAAREGDGEAFARLYEEFGPMVHAILLARAPRVDVEDLVQDVFLTALQRLPSLQRLESFGAWLAAIARNRATDALRRERDLVELEETEWMEPMDPRIEAVGVLRVIRKLPEAYRETLVMRLVEGMTGPEIAERTGRKPRSVRVNLHRGMALLRTRLNEENDDAR